MALGVPGLLEWTRHYCGDGTAQVAAMILDATQPEQSPGGATMIKYISPVFPTALLAFALCMGIAPVTWAMGYPQDPSYAASENREATDANGQRPRPSYYTPIKKDGALAPRLNCPRPGNCRTPQEAMAMQP
jgi:hypothetical protein